MLTLEGYEIGEQIHRGRRSHVYRGRRKRTEEVVVIKTSATDHPSAAELERYRREFEITRTIKDDHVLRPLALEPCQERLVLIEEAFSGQPLDHLVPSGGMRPQAFLPIALEITRGLAAIHAHEVIHGAIHPGNILVDPASGTVKLIDFSLASQQPQDPAAAERGQSERSEAFLPFMAPEQTGRMNRAVDHRADFYSLGATFYFMLSGAPPFEERDPLALVHSHLARSPLPLTSRVPQLPPVLWQLVQKLLAKNAEDRYQSARGLEADLERFWSDLQRLGVIPELPLGQADVRERFELPQRLYGREAERKALLAAFSQTANPPGSKQLYLVAGYSGVGKSSLVCEVKAPIAERGGYFITGKCEEPPHGAPYAAVAQAFSQLAQQLLTESEERLARWRTELHEQLQPNAQVVLEVVPALEKILGPQPPPPNLAAVEVQNRFHFTFKKLVQIFARAEHPLVLFLDDLQWADPATLQLLEVLMRGEEPRHLLVFGAYRDNEVHPTHPLAFALDRMTRAGVKLQTLLLMGMTAADLEQLIADALGTAPGSVRELAQLVHDKTGGNAFFVNELMKLLYQEKMLSFSGEARQWSWDRQRTEELGISENVVDLLIRKLRKLPPVERHALELAACIGDHFSLSSFARAQGVSPRAAAAALAPVVHAGLLVALDPIYPAAGDGAGFETTIAQPPEVRLRFRHDRIRQAAAALLPEPERVQLHLTIGRLLLEATPVGARDERVFELVDHFNVAQDIMADPDERVHSAALNLVAGKKARASAAYRDAARYFRSGIAFLPPNAWYRSYNLAHELELGWAESEYLSGDFEAAVRRFEDLLGHTRTNLEKATVQGLRLVLEINRSRYEEAFRIGQQALALFGIRVPRHPGKRRTLLVRFARIQLLLRGRRGEDLLRLPPMTSPEALVCTSLLSDMLVPAWFLGPEVFAWVDLRCMQLTLREGRTPLATVAYNAFGAMLIALPPQDFEGGHSFGKLALSVAMEASGAPQAGKITYLFAFSHNHWQAHARTSVSCYKQARRVCIENGDFVYACYAAAYVPMTLAMVGEPLPEVLREADDCIRTIRQLRYEDVAVEATPVRQLVLCLRGETAHATSFSGGGVDEAAFVRQLEGNINHMPLAMYAMFKLQVLFLAGRHREALALALAREPVVTRMGAALLRVPEFVFYASLTAVARLREGASGEERRQARRLLRQGRAQMTRWAAAQRDNFEHKRLLIEAEATELAGGRERAWRNYDAAIAGATDAGYTQNAALAAELAGRAFLRQERAPVAGFYLQKAHTGYRDWGATVKAAALEREYASLFPGPAAAEASPPTLDALSVIKATQPISSEIHLDRLLTRMMAIVVENAGAERGALAVADEDELKIEAVGREGGADISVLTGLPIEGSPHLSAAIVRYVLRTGEAVVLDDAARSGPFTADPYVRENRAKSVLCLPLRHQDRNVGVLFLENRLAAGAFTQARVQLLRVLASQTATSLVNARLYGAMRELNDSLAAENRDRIRAEEAVRASESRLHRLLEGLPVGVLVLTPEGRPYLINRMAHAILGPERSRGRRRREAGRPLPRAPRGHGRPLSDPAPAAGARAGRRHQHRRRHRDPRGRPGGAAVHLGGAHPRRKRQRGVRDRRLPGHQRPAAGRGRAGQTADRAAPVAEDGVHRAAGRRHRPRLQQSAGAHHGLRQHGPRPPGQARAGGHARGDLARRRPGRRPDPATARLWPPPGAGDAASGSQCRDPGVRARAAPAGSGEHRHGAEAGPARARRHRRVSGRSHPAAADRDEPGGQRQRRHARRRHADHRDRLGARRRRRRPPALRGRAGALPGAGGS